MNGHSLREEIAAHRPIRRKRLSVPGEAGNLAARMDTPDGPVRTHAILAHCFTCSKDLTALSKIARHLAESGIGVIRFDMTGLGQSEGQFSETTFRSNVRDYLSVATYVQQNLGPVQLFMGLSLGGAAAIAAANQFPQHRLEPFRAIATIAAPSSTRHLRQTLLQMNPALRLSSSGTIQLGGSSFEVRRALLDDLDSYPLEQDIRSNSSPLLLLHSPVDQTVPFDEALQVLSWSTAPTSLVTLPDADHLLTNKVAGGWSAAEYAAAQIGLWALANLPE